jgi:YNFM family putative membrane transporter
MTVVSDFAAAEKISADDPSFRRVCLALILSGFSAFSALYCVQPILPVFASDFHIAPAAASLAISISTIALAVGLIFAGPLSDAIGRKPVILASMTASGLLMIASVFAPNWHALVALRAVLGFLLGGITAINLTYLAEEVDLTSLGMATGFVLAGNSVGSMSARLVVGVATDYVDWRWPMAGLGLFSLASAALMAAWLPASRHFEPAPLSLGATLGNYGRHLASPGLAPAFVAGFLLMGSFVAFFNYIGFRLLSPPFGLSQTVVGLISLVFLPSSWAAVVAGRFSDRIGPTRVHVGAIATMILGLALTAASSFLALGVGTLLFALGFFAAHSTATGHVGRTARVARAQATSMYQIAFYVGASIAGTVGGLFWQALGWNGIILMLGLMLSAAAVNGRKLR